MNTKKDTSLLAFFPRGVIALFFVIIFLGLLGTWLPAFGFLPVIGKTTFTFAPWIDLFAFPGFKRSMLSTLVSGWGATILAVFFSLTVLSLSYGNALWRLLEKSLAPILSIPHAAFAIGFGFLIAPSGWIIRLISPAITGFQRSPDWLITNDPYGFSLMVAMCLKEIPFLFFVIIGALSRLRVGETLLVGRSLGYHSTQIWMKVILPRLLPQIRLAIFAVLAYSLSVVDVAMIIGPTVPPTFAVMIVKWFNDPDISLRLMGAAGATFLLCVVILSVLFAWLVELLYRYFIKSTVTNGVRKSILSHLKPVSYVMVIIIIFLTMAAFIVLVIWSFSWRWRFPQSLPSDWTTQFWMKGMSQAAWPVLNTLTIGLASSIIGLILVIGCLEYEVFLKTAGRKINWDRLIWITYMPLLIPQIAFIFGAQIGVTILRIDGLLISLVWSHLLFVYPYMFLTLGGMYREYDDRMSQLATLLCGSKWRTFWKIKLPILTRPILTSLAVGFAVSVSQYIPTLFIGAGRYVTITTEAVTLASGSDRRILAVFALCQQLLPFFLFAIAIFTPKFLFRDRKGMNV